MVYSLWLLGLSVLFVLIERLWPRTRRPLWRRGLLTDLCYLVFNSEYLGVMIGVASIPLWAFVDRAITATAFLGILAPLPLLLQLAVLLVGFDFARW